MCSFYHYVLDYYGKGMHDIVSVHAPVADRTMDEFVAEHADRELIPSYWRELDFAAESGDANFARFFARYFGHDFEPRKVFAHESSNPGWDHYCATGEISAEARAKVERSSAMAINLEVLAAQEDFL